MKLDDLLKKLKRIVGADWVRTDDLTRYYYGADIITYLGQGAIYPENHPLLVVYPGSAKDVQAVVRLVIPVVSSCSIWSIVSLCRLW